MMYFLTEDENTIGEYKWPKELRHEIKKEWSDDEAKYVYVLYKTTRFWGHTLGQKRIGLFKKVTVRENGKPTDITSAVSEGNIDWAKKIAKQYGIGVPQ